MKTPYTLSSMTSLPREELIQILQFIYSENLDDYMRVDTMTNKELLDFIQTDYQIISYYLSQWNQYREENEILNQENIDEVLDRLELGHHYLARLDFKDWNEYDISNYRATQYKRGCIQMVFGIYDAEIKQEDVYEVTTPPKRFFDTLHLAQNARKTLYESAKFSKDEIHVLHTYKST